MHFNQLASNEPQSFLSWSLCGVNRANDESFVLCPLFQVQSVKVVLKLSAFCGITWFWSCVPLDFSLEFFGKLHPWKKRRIFKRIVSAAVNVGKNTVLSLQIFLVIQQQLVAFYFCDGSCLHWEADLNCISQIASF